MKSDFLLSPAPLKYFKYLLNKKLSINSMEISSKIDITPHHIIRLNKKFKKMGLIEYEKIDGRTKGVILTNKGRKVALSLNKIYNLLEK